MKINFLSLILVIILSVATFAQEEYALLDNDLGTSMKPILARAEPLIEEIEDEGMEIVRMEFDIIATEKETYRTLHDEWTYEIVAFGDYRIRDIDLALYEKVNGQWDRVAKDAEDDDEASITIRPTKMAEYKIKISVYQFKEDYMAGHYGLLILHE